MKTIRNMESSNLKTLSKIMVGEIQLMMTDINYLTRSVSSHLKSEGSLENQKKTLENIFFLFCAEKGIYDQVRLIDNTGKEILRVNYNNGDPFMVPENQLQIKKNRYYFRDVIDLNQNEIYISPFDLNIENGELEKPIKPMIRIGTPITNDKQGKEGIVVLNYLGDRLFEKINAYKEDFMGNLSIVNSDGYWLNGSDSEFLWGFMFPDKKDISYAKYFENEWKSISSSDYGSIRSKNGLINHITIYPADVGWHSSDGSPFAYQSSTIHFADKDYYWKAILQLEPDTLSSLLHYDVANHALLAGFLIVITLFGSFALANSNLESEAVKKELERNEK